MAACCPHAYVVTPFVPCSLPFLLQVGPITLAIIVMASLTLIMLAAIKDLILNHK